jgi:hypothetical protein
MAFRQEGEDDQDMTPMHMTMIDASNGKGVQQGYPSKEGGPRLIQFESPRWRHKTTQVRVHLGIPRAARTKNDAQVSYGVHFGCSLYGWEKNFIELPMAPVCQIKIPSESMRIIKTSGHPESTRVLRRRLLGCWPVYHVEAQKGHDRGL